jgi:hypothetical protein
MNYWIKERYNPQLGTYYVACGQLSKKEAKRHERSIYGDNIMHEYCTQTDYEAKLAQLRQLGKQVQ